MTRQEILDSMDWGGMDENSRTHISDEIVNKKVYERIPVKEGDVVLDLGATAGDFALCIMECKPKHIYCVEPYQLFYEALVKNTKGFPITCINKAIGIDVKFSTLVEGLKIDFIKTDCEGGEYELFDKDGLNYILENVRVISGEWHLRPSFYYQLDTRIAGGSKEKFCWFRDTVLPKFYQYEVWDWSNTVNIKWDLFNQHFLDYYTEVMFTIKVREG